MAKKGLISLVKDDKIKAVYIHRNAQLDKIGKRVVKLCRENTVDELKELYDRLILVDEDSRMPPEQREAYKKYMPEQCYTEDLDWTTALKYTKDATNLFGAVSLMWLIMPVSFHPGETVSVIRLTWISKL